MSNNKQYTMGDTAVCRSCGKGLVYRGKYWEHVGTTPRHIAVPVDVNLGHEATDVDPVWNIEQHIKKLQALEPGQPCGPGCANHVTHPCERCGRYQAGLAGGPPETAAGEVSYPLMSMPWETQEGWEKEVAQSVVFSNMAPREAKEILDLVGVSLGQPGYTVKLILKAIKATPHLQDLIRVAELVEVAGDTDIVCPFCAVVGDREHLSDCLVTRSRMVLARVKAATQS